jgi:hypothetical protein
MVLRNYGVEVVDGVDEQQVSCVFLEHGSHDRNKSARYFAYDREKANDDESVYCYKCCKRWTPFWYVYKYEKEYNGLKLTGMFPLMKKRFGVAFPRDILLDFDPEKHYTFEDTQEGEAIRLGLKRAIALREIKKRNLPIYLEKIKQIIVGS